MTWSDTTSPAELRRALGDQNFADAQRLVNELIADLHEMPRLMGRRAATTVLSSLRAAAWFEQLFAVAQHIREGGQDDPEVIRQLAQATIEEGRTTEAMETLHLLRDRLEQQRSAEGDPVQRQRLDHELGESLGLLGRAYKQLYVDAVPTQAEPRSHDLAQAKRYYEQAYRDRLGDYLWHGVNYIALETHGQRLRRGQPHICPGRPDAERILEALDHKENQAPLAPWDLANRAEALLACGRPREAIDAVQTYLEVPGLNAFNVQSTRRQFVELWQLDESRMPGGQILRMMAAKLAQLGGTPKMVDLVPHEMGELERVWGETGYQPLQWLTTAVERAKGVARLGPNQYEGWGTGFVFDGAWIGGEYAGRNLLLTNAHVSSDDPAVQRTYPYPQGHDAQTAVFLESAADIVEIRATDQVWTSPPSELDATLLELEHLPGGAVPPPVAGRRPMTEGPDARVNVIGHPKRLGVRISLQDNQVVHVSDRYVHYRTPTDPGSSGSPVFNQQWELVALHHRSSAEWQANEGVLIDGIIDTMIAEL